MLYVFCSCLLFRRFLMTAVRTLLAVNRFILDIFWHSLMERNNLSDTLIWRSNVSDGGQLKSCIPVCIFWTTEIISSCKLINRSFPSHLTPDGRASWIFYRYRLFPCSLSHFFMKIRVNKRPDFFKVNNIDFLSLMPFFIFWSTSLRCDNQRPQAEN